MLFLVQPGRNPVARRMRWPLIDRNQFGAVGAGSAMSIGTPGAAGTNRACESRGRGLARHGVALLSAWAAGCATLEAPGPDVSEPLAAACLAEFRALDEKIEAAGVRDAQATRIEGYPYLRVDRFVAALRPGAGQNPQAIRALAQRMRSLDLEARRHEIANLPRHALVASAGASAEAKREDLRLRVNDCASILLKHDLAQGARRAGLLARAKVPDDYSDLSRVLGLYALTRHPFVDGVRRYQADVRLAFARSLTSPAGGETTRIGPPARMVLPRSAIARIVGLSVRHALDPAHPDPSALGALFAAYAPVFEIEQTGAFDRIGALRWTGGAQHPSIDPAVPVVYGHVAFTRYRGRTLLQLVYTVWFSERPAREDGDLLAGVLDGLTWRVTLAPDGTPLIYDVMHPCGCFHMFFPTARATALPAPDDADVEWAFVPQVLPRLAPGVRVAVRIATRTHAVERVRVMGAADTDPSTHYGFRAYDTLRSLPQPDGGRRSIFGSDGIIAGSERPERFLFWPMGIRSAGAMRQWGRHATAFVGRRHFDDADLFEKRFTFDLK